MKHTALEYESLFYEADKKIGIAYAVIGSVINTVKLGLDVQQDDQMISGIDGAQEVLGEAAKAVKEMFGILNDQFDEIKRLEAVNGNTRN